MDSLIDIITIPFVLAMLLAAYAGAGVVVVPGRTSANVWRIGAARCLIGWLTFAIMFTLMWHAATSYSVAVMTIILFGAGFTAIATITIQHQVAEWRSIIVCILLVTLVLIVLRGIVFASLPGDPYLYAACGAMAFNTDWIGKHIGDRQIASFVLGIVENCRFTRGSAIAPVFIPTMIGSGVDIQWIYRIAILQYVLALILMIDILGKEAPITARVIMSLAGIGSMSLVSARVGGQVNQAFAILLVTSAVWWVRYIDAKRTSAWFWGATGFLIAAGYPEFLLATPFYLACCAIVGLRVKDLVICGAAVLVGAVVVVLSTRFEVVRFLVHQSGSLVGWNPLGVQLADPWDAWWTIVHGSPNGYWLLPTWSLFLVACVACYVAENRHELGRRRVCMRGRLEGAAAAVLAGCSFAAATWSLGVTGNVNYAVFKLAGWIGPGLMVVGWVLVRHRGQLAGLAGVVVLLSIASFRAIDLWGWLSLSSPAATGPRVMYRETSGPVGGECVVISDSAYGIVVLRAIAESSAAVRGCGVETGRLAAWAGLFISDVPFRWKPSERKRYAVTVRNLGEDVWSDSGEAAVVLGVQVRRVDSDTVGMVGRRAVRDGAYGNGSASPELIVPLTTVVPVGGGADFVVELTSPAVVGTYEVEHRLGRVRGEWSEQVLAAAISVR